MRRFSIHLFALAAALVVAPGLSAQTVHEVKMVDKSMTLFTFEPADIVVKPGDVIRWINTGTLGQPHNVDFRSPASAGFTGGDPAIVGTMSPFLMTVGETWEITIDERFEVGVTHPYVCTPHEAMGMKGTIKVEGGAPETR